MELSRSDLAADPIEQFRRWFESARTTGVPEPEAMALSTATADGRPSVRYVLMRGLDHRGWVFYTNTRSRKGAEIAASGWAALAFRWALVDRQVRVNGRVAFVTPEESDAYFATRGRDSQLGAWASDQSQVIPDRSELVRRFNEAADRFEGRPVPRPPWWGGYRVEPVEVEFWQQGGHRLHDRFRFRRNAIGWVVERLAP